jgi:hypothetical protein
VALLDFAPRRELKGRGQANLPVVDLWNYIINGNDRLAATTGD